MQIFLAIATLLQLAFLYSGFKTLLKKESPAQESKAVCLIALAFADFVWAFACFLHCTMNRSKGEFWGGDAGCDAQGYYSALACFSTMFFTMQITYVTHVHASKGSAAVPSKQRLALSSVVLYAFAMLLSAIPFLNSTGGFVLPPFPLLSPPIGPLFVCQHSPMLHC